MKPHYPTHTAILTLLENDQVEACRLLVEQRAAELLAPQAEAQAVGQTAADVFRLSQEREQELGCLHTIWCRVLHAQSNFEEAALKAEFGALQARKTGDTELLAEALHLAAICYGQVGNYGLAIRRHTECLTYVTGLERAKELFNRGHTYERMRAYAGAVRDYEAALQIAAEHEPKLARPCRINVAWNLILLHEFDRAEPVLAELAAVAEADPLLQLQLAHDRVQMACLKGEHLAAVNAALAALQQANQAYPHVRAALALSLMAVSTGVQKPTYAAAFGVLAKRLGGIAQRPEIDYEAGRELQELDIQSGTEPLVQPLLKIREVTPRAVDPRKRQRRHQRKPDAK